MSQSLSPVPALLLSVSNLIVSCLKVKRVIKKIKMIKKIKKIKKNLRVVSHLSLLISLDARLKSLDNCISLSRSLFTSL